MDVKAEGELMERILSFKDRPADFIIFAYPWGVQGSPLENIEGPRKWQWDELMALQNHLTENRLAYDLSLPFSFWKAGWASGRGPGKSALFGMLMHWHLSTHPGAHGIVTANTETQLRTKTFPELGRWITLAVNSHWFEVEGFRVGMADWLTKMFKEQRGIDSKYWNAVGSNWTEENPDAFAGAHNAYGLLLLMDEAAGIPATVWDTAGGFFSEPTLYRFHLAASQMRRTSGRFYDLFHNEKFAREWHTRQMSVRGMEGIDQRWVQSYIELYGEGSDQVRVEIDGMAPISGEQQFIAADLVDSAFQNRLLPDYGAALIMGIDPAPRGRTLIRFRQGRNGRDCCGKDTRVEVIGEDNVQLAVRVAALVNTYKPDLVCIDFGMGTGLIDILKHTYKIKVVEVNFGRAVQDKKSEWATHGTELWARVRDWLPTGGLAPNDDLKAEMISREWRWSGREDNKKILESKEDMKARGVSSPDDMDAFACTFEMQVVRRDSPAARSPMGAARIAPGTDDWQPFQTVL